MSHPIEYFLSGDLSTYDPRLLNALNNLAIAHKGLYNVFLSYIDRGEQHEIVKMLSPQHIFTSDNTLFEKIKGDDKFKIGNHKLIQTTALSHVNLLLSNYNIVKNNDEASAERIRYSANHICIYGSIDDRIKLDNIYTSQILNYVKLHQSFDLYDFVVDHLPGKRNDEFYRWIELCRNINQTCQYTIDSIGICVCVITLDDQTKYVLSSKQEQQSVLELKTLSGDIVETHHIIEMKKYIIPRHVYIHYSEMITFDYKDYEYQSIFSSHVFLELLELFDEYVIYYVVK